MCWARARVRDRTSSRPCWQPGGPGGRLLGDPGCARPGSFGLLLPVPDLFVHPRPEPAHLRGGQPLRELPGDNGADQQSGQSRDDVHLRPASGRSPGRPAHQGVGRLFQRQAVAVLGPFHAARDQGQDSRPEQAAPPGVVDDRGGGIGQGPQGQAIGDGGQHDLAVVEGDPRPDAQAAGLQDLFVKVLPQRPVFLVALGHRLGDDRITFGLRGRDEPQPEHRRGEQLVHVPVAHPVYAPHRVRPADHLVSRVSRLVLVRCRVMRRPQAEPQHIRDEVPTGAATVPASWRPGPHGETAEDCG